MSQSDPVPQMFNTALTSWKNAGPRESFKKVASTVATAFEQEFDINVRGLVREKGKLRVETEAEYAKRTKERHKSILKWIENNKPWFDKHKLGPLDLLPVPLPEETEPEETRDRAKSARGLFIHDHPHIGARAKAEAAKAGLASGPQTTEWNLAFSREIDRVKAEEPAKWQQYEELAAQSKEDARAANAAQDARSEREDVAQQHASANSGNNEEAKALAQLEEQRSRLRLTARVSVDKWAAETQTHIFTYIGWIDATGNARRTLVSAGDGSRDTLVNHLKTVQNGELVTALNDFILQTRGSRVKPATPGTSTSLAAPPDATDLAANERSDAPTETAEAAQGSPQTDGEVAPAPLGTGEADMNAPHRLPDNSANSSNSNSVDVNPRPDDGHAEHNNAATQESPHTHRSACHRRSSAGGQQ
ncbi:uncharacterized protein B0H18DRAFT_1215784 [Fomitopsis serialis]|uniref:uncharacterized protein n=1 Tax=Fomitopsis serialis TaxID=139415 RepID=UPI00200796B8|nr:uncharacterized protein B0H18DRAFT_1215784 [Neoantrodia serialis]KAH9914941.1 hypothetical protein B0H18DRAFT_1215784 [Neoantrodia serialis]